MAERKDRRVEMSAAEFKAKHKAEIIESDRPLLPGQPGTMPLSELRIGGALDQWIKQRAANPRFQRMQELKQDPLVRLLRAAAKENSPAAYRELLEGWLIILGIEAPDGVFIPSRRPRGAPQKEST